MPSYLNSSNLLVFCSNISLMFLSSITLWCSLRALYPFTDVRMSAIVLLCRLNERNKLLRTGPGGIYTAANLTLYSSWEAGRKCTAQQEVCKGWTK